MKKIAIIIAGTTLLLASLLVFANYQKQSEEAFGAGPRVLTVRQGGTGAATFTSGECLVGAGTSTITTAACGGGGADPFTWAIHFGGTTAVTSSMWNTGNSFTSGTLYTEGLKITNKTTKPERFPIFGYSTSTAWTASTTVYLGAAVDAQTWEDIRCETDTGTLNVSIYDGTNRMDMLNASTTIGVFNFATNNVFTANESRRVDFGTPASTPTQITCSARYKIN